MSVVLHVNILIQTLFEYVSKNAATDKSPQITARLQSLGSDFPDKTANCSKITPLAKAAALFSL